MLVEHLSGNHPVEPGVVRNDVGRIIETGWPQIPPDQWSVAYAELHAAIKKQIMIEELMEQGMMRDRRGALRFGNGLFNISDVSLGRDLSDAIYLKLEDLADEADGVVKVCDIGGGDGSLLGNVVWQFRGRFAVYDGAGKIETTMTSLIDFGLREITTTSVDRTVLTSVELPPDDFYQAFDIVTAQNSVYFWSSYPELATFNVYKMLKSDGLLLATLPQEPFNIQNETNFRPLEYLQSNPYFKIIGVDDHRLQSGYIVGMQRV